VETSQRCDNESLHVYEIRRKEIEGSLVLDHSLSCIPFMGGRVSTTIPPKSYHAEKEDGPVVKDLVWKRGNGRGLRQQALGTEARHIEACDRVTFVAQREVYPLCNSH